MEQEPNYEQCKYFEIDSPKCPKRENEIIQQAQQSSHLQPYNGD